MAEPHQTLYNQACRLLSLTDEQQTQMKHALANFFERLALVGQSQVELLQADTNQFLNPAQQQVLSAAMSNLLSQYANIPADWKQ